MSEASGTAKISEEALGDARGAFDQAVADAAGEQLALPVEEPEGDDWLGDEHLALPDASEITAIQMETGCGVQAAVIEWRNRGAKGRKPGARNRRSADFARYLGQFGPHPGIAMMRIVARPVEMLATEMGCSKLEALDRQIRCAAELLPYVEGKRPVDVNVNSNGHMTLIMGGAAAPIDGGALVSEDGVDVPDLSLAEDQESMENQGVDEAARSVSE